MIIPPEMKRFITDFHIVGHLTKNKNTQIKNIFQVDELSKRGIVRLLLFSRTNEICTAIALTCRWEPSHVSQKLIRAR